MLETICDVLEIAYKNKWISTRDGNASFKEKGKNYMYVTPTGLQKQNLTADMMLKFQFSKKNIDNAMKKDSDKYKIKELNPTEDLQMHILLQKNTLENRVIIHLHPTHIIAAMYAGLDLQKLAIDFWEINRYTRVGPSVDVVLPHSQELANAVSEAFNLNKETGEVEFDIIGLSRHGIVVIAKDALACLEHVERLQHICEIALLANAVNRIV